MLKQTSICHSNFGNPGVPNSIGSESSICCRNVGRDATFLENVNVDLSGGESQIAALLRAIQLELAVLLLDEPTAALDTMATAAVETLVETWLNESPRGEQPSGSATTGHKPSE